MSKADNLETLSNAELRAKCKEHGLVDVPVTNSTRGVLIKKLRSTLSGSALVKKSSNRRETIHGSKVYPSIEEVKRATVDKEDAYLGGNRSPGRTVNRRTIAATPSSAINKQATLAAAAPSVNVSTTAATAAPVTVRRRSALQQTPVAVVSHPTISLESDEEDDIMVAAAKRAEKLITYKSNDSADAYARSRSSRSSSLTKTGVLTTSYVQEIAPIPAAQVYVEDDEEEEGELMDSDGASEVIPQTQQIYNKYSSSVPQSGARNLPTATFAAPNLYSRPAQSTRYTLDSATASSRYSNTQSSVPSYYSPSTGRHSTSAYSSTLRSMPPPVSAAKVSDSNNAYFTEQSDDTDTNNEEEPFKTPFLSNFTRNLERMKVEPIGRNSTLADNEMAHRYTRGSKTYESPLRRPKINAKEEVSLGQVFDALDEKYKIKRNFLLLLLLLLLVFLFVLFWQ